MCRSHHAGECSVHDWFKYLTAVGTNDLRYQLPEKVEYNPMYFFLGDIKKTHTHTAVKSTHVTFYPNVAPYQQ